jgi:hypothetical protein
MPVCIPTDARDFHVHHIHGLGLPVQPGTLQILHFAHVVYLCVPQDFEIDVTTSLYSISCYFVFLTEAQNSNFHTCSHK